MDWPVLVIALIPVAVWILATIFRGVEEANEKNRPRPRGDGAQVKVPRRPSGELDRFLEEARRRRDPAQKPRREPTPAEAALPERVPPPVEKPAPRPPARREEHRPRTRPRVEIPIPAPPVVVVTTPAPAPEPVPPPPPPRLAAPPRPVSPVAKRLGAMLRDRDSLALAVILREVFDRPVSQRR